MIQISKKNVYCLSLLLLPSFLLLSFGQSNIKTLQLFNPQTNDLTPFIGLNDHLIFSFDDLDAGYVRYTYKLKRMNRDWESSDIFKSEWLSGYDSDIIRDYKNSFNTLLNYTHYELAIPNRNSKITMSGNYIIELYGPDKSLPLAQKRFAIYEDLTDVGVFVDRINGLQVQNQKLEVRVSSSLIDLTQNVKEQKLVVLKNNNWNDVLVKDHAVFTTPGLLTYNQQDLRFAGGTEYIFFDTKNKRISGLNTERIIEDTVYQTVLYADSFYPDEPYIDRPDIDGNYYIRNVEAPNPLYYGSEADYTNVHFALQTDLNLDGKKICVYGAFNNYSCSNEDFLAYNPSSGFYETNQLLKQGYYDYNYAIYTPKNNTYDYISIPGNYWETENLYQALFYYRPWGKRYDLILGYGEGYSRPSLR